ncbi:MULTISPECIES: BID domain-containing T4SS effector [unclassified Bartonella]|uniref:BID domain-containing T4SS effector n=1 Tax=unclassified Bartonella TaxID=2645622 RepID=UPI000999E53B|nr:MULTISPECIES: BID domain-containing T4SS effector [unclassified Bartonella]AQX27892.1 Bartonella effector protein Bep8/2 [Bartonella sp. JB15]AQX29172.1 Bartonella effector protein Bep8/2 [Bartonella sp. JB63]
MLTSSDMSLVRNYAYPNTTTLKNKYGIMDFKKLQEKCTRDAKKVIANLRQESLPEKFDSSYLKYLHKSLFQEAFEWAGYTRDLPFTFKDGTTAQMLMMKMPNSNIFFAASNKIRESLKEFDQMLAAKNNLQGLSRKEFIDEAVKLFSFLDYIHPFRGGNGPTQRLFFEKLAKAAGHTLDFSVVTKKRMRCACANAIILKGDKAHEAMKHLFEDISNPEKAGVLRELFNCMPKFELERLDDECVVIPREGISYTGIYRGASVDSIIVETADSCVICHKDYLTPEQIKALKPGNELSFTGPINKDLDQVLIPAEKLAPLKEEEIIKKIKNTACVQENRRKIESLSKLVYGVSEILDKNLHLIHKNPQIGEQLAEQIEKSPRSIAKLTGFKIGPIKNPRRVVAERNISELSKAIKENVDIVEYAKKTILKEHQKKQKRVEQAIKKPSKEVQKIFELQSNNWKEALKAENPEVLHKDVCSFLCKINSRLSVSERKSIDSADYEKLAKSIGISDSKAKIIIQAVNQGKELCKKLETIKANRPKVMTTEVFLTVL